MYTTPKSSKSTQTAYMSSVVGAQTTSERIRDNNVTVLTTVNKTYEASSMSYRGRLMEMKGPMGHALANQKKENVSKREPKLDHSDSGDDKNKEEPTLEKEPAQDVDLSKPKTNKDSTRSLKDSTQSLTPKKGKNRDTFENSSNKTINTRKNREVLKSPRERPESEKISDVKAPNDQTDKPLEKTNSKTLINRKNPSMASPKKNEDLKGSFSRISKTEEKVNDAKVVEDKKRHTKDSENNNNNDRNNDTSNKRHTKPETDYTNNNSGEELHHHHHNHHHHHHNEEDKDKDNMPHKDKEENKPHKQHKHHTEDTKKDTNEAPENRYKMRKKANSKKNATQ